MNIRTAVPALVTGMAGVLAAAGLITFAIRDAPDYADLVPAPDEIVWEEGDHTTLWLSTNRHAVDVLIDNIALGLGDIEERREGSDGVAILGEGPGCVDVVVKSLTVAHSSGNIWRATGTIDRGPNTTGDVEVHLRYYRLADQLPGGGVDVAIIVSERVR